MLFFLQRMQPIRCHLSADLLCSFGASKNISAEHELVLYHVSCKVRCWKSFSSIQYLQGKHLHASLPSSSELVHRTRKQSDLFCRWYQVSFINQVTKTIKQCNLHCVRIMNWTHFWSADENRQCETKWIWLALFQGLSSSSWWTIDTLSWRQNWSQNAV